MIMYVATYIYINYEYLIILGNADSFAYATVHNYSAQMHAKCTEFHAIIGGRIL